MCIIGIVGIEKKMGWVRDIRIAPNDDKLQDITVERLGEQFRWEMFVTQRMKAAAVAYHGLWSMGRILRTRVTSRAMGYVGPCVDVFPQSVRRDEDLLAACIFLAEWVEDRA